MAVQKHGGSDPERTQTLMVWGGGVMARISLNVLGAMHISVERAKASKANKAYILSSLTASKCNLRK